MAYMTENVRIDSVQVQVEPPDTIHVIVQGSNTPDGPMKVIADKRLKIGTGGKMKIKPTPIRKLDVED